MPLAFLGKLNKKLNPFQKSLAYPGITSLALGGALGASAGVGIPCTFILPIVATYAYTKQSTQHTKWKKAAFAAAVLPLSFLINGISVVIGASVTGKQMPETPKTASPTSETPTPAQPEEIYKAEGHYTYRYMSGDTLDENTKAKLVWHPKSKKLEYGFVSPNNSQYNKYSCTSGGANILVEQLNPDGSKADIYPDVSSCIITFDKDGLPKKIISYQGAASASCPAGADCQLISVSTKWQKTGGASVNATSTDLEQATQSRQDYKDAENAAIDKKLADLERLSPGVMSEICAKSIWERTDEEQRLCHRYKTR